MGADGGHSAFGAAVKNTVDAADEMSKAAAKFGVPIEELSRLKYAADLSDVSLDGLGTSLGRLSKNMVAAATGAGPMADAFAAAGIAVTNADGSLRSSTDVLGQIADKFAALPDGAEKTALAMQLLGKSGAEMIPLLNGGSAALAQMGKEAETFGQVFTSEMGQQAEAFNDNLTRLQGAFGNLAADLTAKLLPYLKQFTDWLVANGPQLATNAGNFLDFAAKVVAAFGTIKPALDAFSDAMHVVVDGIVAAGNAATALSAQVSQGFSTAIAAASDGANRMVQALLDVRDRFVEIGRDLISGLWEGMKERFAAIVEPIRNIANSIAGIFRTETDTHSPSRVFAEIGGDLMDGLRIGMEANADGVRSDVSTLASDLAGAFKGILFQGQSFRESLSGLLGNVSGRLLDAGIGSILGAVKIPGFANGTNFAPGGLAWVGEHGRELVNLPRGSQVIPNHDLGKLGGGGSVVEVRLSEGLVAAILNEAAGQSVRITQAGIGANNSTLPSRVARISSDPRRR